MNSKGRVARVTFAYAAAALALAQMADASPPKRTSPILSGKPPILAVDRVGPVEPQRKPVGGIVPASNNKLLGAPLQSDLVIAAFYGDGQLPEGFPGTGYCDPNPAGGAPNKIRLRVRNEGGAQADASVLRVDFATGGSTFLNVPALAAGGETSGAVAIPAGCYPAGFSTNCQFTMQVDAYQQVNESSELNNQAMSFCVAPAG